MKKNEEEAIIRALSEEEPECEHKRFRETQFVEVSENYFVSELYCADCGFFFGFFTQKTQKTLDLHGMTTEMLEWLDELLKTNGCHYKLQNGGEFK